MSEANADGRSKPPPNGKGRPARALTLSNFRKCGSILDHRTFVSMEVSSLLPVGTSVMLGICLAAACGLRVFLPLFIASVLSYLHVGGVDLRWGFEWMSTLPAVIAFGAATLVEILGYYIPYVDHLLDVIAVPLASVAGTVVAASTMAHLPPLWTWSLALIAGGGLAGLIAGSTATTRVASTASTGGLGNHVVSTAETAGAAALSLLAWFLPIIAFVLLGLLLWWVLRWFKRQIN